MSIPYYPQFDDESFHDYFDRLNDDIFDSCTLVMAIFYGVNEATKACLDYVLNGENMSVKQRHRLLFQAAFESRQREEEKTLAYESFLGGKESLEEEKKGDEVVESEVLEPPFEHSIEGQYEVIYVGEEEGCDDLVEEYADYHEKATIWDIEPIQPSFDCSLPLIIEDYPLLDRTSYLTFSFYPIPMEACGPPSFEIDLAHTLSLGDHVVETLYESEMESFKVDDIGESVDFVVNSSIIEVVKPPLNVSFVTLAPLLSQPNFIPPLFSKPTNSLISFDPPPWVDVFDIVEESLVRGHEKYKEGLVMKYENSNGLDPPFILYEPCHKPFAYPPFPLLQVWAHFLFSVSYDHGYKACSILFDMLRALTCTLGT